MIEKNCIVDLLKVILFSTHMTDKYSVIIFPFRGRNGKIKYLFTHLKR